MAVIYQQKLMPQKFISVAHINLDYKKLYINIYARLYPRCFYAIYNVKNHDIFHLSNMQKIHIIWGMQGEFTMPNPKAGLNQQYYYQIKSPISAAFLPPVVVEINRPLFFSLLILLCFTSVADAAGYNCPAYRKYTSCNSGYYLSDCGTFFNGQTITDPSAGNSCKTCPTGTGTTSYNCPG